MLGVQNPSINLCLFHLVDGGYSDWSPWSACTVTCGGGSRLRNRKCNNPAPANDGKTCFDQQLGSEMESEACNIEPCEGKNLEVKSRWKSLKLMKLDVL